MDNNGRLDWGNFPKELLLLLYIIGHEEKELNASSHYELFQDIDWDHFINLVKHHRVFPLIYKILKDLDRLPIPLNVVKEVQLEYKLNTFEMLRLTGEMERFCRHFTEAAIPCLFLKGPVLAMELYGDISLRSSCDLDVLIPLKDLDRAEELLIKQGYVKDDYFSTAMSDWKWRHHHTTFTHPTRGIKIELHWRLNPGPSIEPSFEELWKRKRVSSNKRISIYSLGREDLFLFLVMHGARHGWSRLRWLVDIDRLSNHALDWKVLQSLLRHFETSHVAGQSLILCNELLHTHLTEDMLVLTEKNRAKKLADNALFYLRNMVNLHSDAVSEDVAKYHKRHLFALMGKRSKLLFIISLLHPYPIDAETLPLPKGLHFLYFPLRPLIWFWRTTRKYVTHWGI
jgi:hypothetical protein